MRARRGGGWRGLVLVGMIAGGCGPGSSERVSPPASDVAATPTAVVEPAAVVVPAANDVPAIVQAFARGEVAEVAGAGSLRQWLAGLAPGLAGDGPIELVFVVDRSLADDAARALALAIAGARSRLPADLRVGLVSFAARGGAWVTRVEAPLAADVHAVVRAASRVEWQPDGGAGVAGGWAGLAAATQLDWQAPAGRRHVVLVLDERDTGAARLEARPAEDAVRRGDVAAWARGAVVHVGLCRLEFRDGRGEGPEAPPDPGVPLAVVAGLVRDGQYIPADSPGAAVSDALAGLADAPADVALVVDGRGKMGQSLADLRSLQPALDRFVATAGHRVALVRWDGEGARVVAGLTHRPGVVPGALRRLRAGSPDDRPRPVFTALAAAQGLAWDPAAQKLVLVLTAAPARIDDQAEAVLAWTDTASVALQIVEPGVTASRRGP